MNRRNLSENEDCISKTSNADKNKTPDVTNCTMSDQHCEKLMFQKASKVIDKNRAPKAVGKKKTAVCRPSARVRLRICAVAAAAVIGCAICGEGLCPYDPYAQDLSLVKAAPSPAHLFGTDRYGRDVLSRVIAGGHASVLSALGLVAVIVLIGTAAGLCGGWFGGVLDTVLMRIADVFLAFPGLVLALAAAAVLGGGLGGAVISLAAVSWPKYARLSRSQTLSVKEEPYIRAAVLAGDGPDRLLLRHILPNIAGPILVSAVTDIGQMMMELAALSFLGLGARAPVPEWGSMMSEGRSLLATHPWLTFAPGLAIFVCVMIFSLLGDALRDVLDPRA